MSWEGGCLVLLTSVWLVSKRFSSHRVALFFFYQQGHLVWNTTRTACSRTKENKFPNKDNRSFLRNIGFTVHHRFIVTFLFSGLRLFFSDVIKSFPRFITSLHAPWSLRGFHGQVHAALAGLPWAGPHLS